MTKQRPLPEAPDIKSLSLNTFSLLNPPLKKGEIGGFALMRLAEIPPLPPLYKRGEILFTDKL
jgi:hypothetical protein